MIYLSKILNKIMIYVVLFCFALLVMQSYNLHFPKLAGIAPLSKNDDVTNKANYRHISMFPIVSKVFGKLIQNQIGGFIESKLFPCMCGYRKGFSAQYALIELIEKTKEIPG